MKTRMIVVMMIALALMSVVAIQAAPIADSVADFAGPPNGGTNNWWYYEWNADSATTYDYTTVNLMTDWSGGMWRGSFSGGQHYPYIGATLVHPAGPNWTGYNLWAVRRWVSDVSEPVTISGHIAKNALGGNGVNGHIFVDGVEKWSQFIDGGDGVGVDYSVNVAVGLGSKVDFALDSNLDVNSDESIFTGTVNAAVPEPSSLLALVMGSAISGLTILRRRFLS